MRQGKHTAKMLELVKARLKDILELQDVLHGSNCDDYDVLSVISHIESAMDNLDYAIEICEEA